MSTTLFAAISIFRPVHALVQHICNKLRGRHAGLPATRAAQSLCQAPRLPRRVRHAGPSRAICRQPPGRIIPTLRVLRVADTGPGSFHGGRMVISGRMADVCAELDRLAAQEASLQAGA